MTNYEKIMNDMTPGKLAEIMDEVTNPYGTWEDTHCRKLRRKCLNTASDSNRRKRKMELIDPNEIKFVIAPIAPFLSGYQVHYEQVAFQQDVDQIRRIEAEPVKHGHVVWAKQNDSYQTQCCSNCHRTFISRPDETIEFCPHCGAKMDEEKESEHD